MDAIDEAVMGTIGRMPGVRRVVLVAAEDRERLRAARTPEAAENRGVEEALSRPRLVCLFKDFTFRPPPEPTLLLIDERGEVLGRELVAGESPPADRRVAFLGKDFVLYAGVRPHGTYRFSLPPVRFPEVERLPGVARVVSASPDTPQDDLLRQRFGIPQGHELASILVGYDVRNP